LLQNPNGDRHAAAPRGPHDIQGFGDVGGAVFVAHCLNDPIVPVEWSQALVSLLEENGYQPVYKTYPIGHQISPAEIADLREWLKLVLPA
jgi:predicted esterase